MLANLISTRLTLILVAFALSLALAAPAPLAMYGDGKSIIESYNAILDIKNELVAMSRSLLDLDKQVTGFPDVNGTVNQAIEIQQTFLQVLSAIDAGTSDIQDTPLTLGLAIIAISDFLSLRPELATVLNTVISKKTALHVLEPFVSNITTIVRQRIVILGDRIDAFGVALINAVPESKQAEAEALRNGFSNMFSVATKAYDNAPQ